MSLKWYPTPKWNVLASSLREIEPMIIVQKQWVIPFPNDFWVNRCLLAPLRGVISFFCVPGVSLRSTPSYWLSSLRNEKTCFNSSLSDLCTCLTWQLPVIAHTGFLSLMKVISPPKNLNIQPKTPKSDSDNSELVKKPPSFILRLPKTPLALS